jgi:purine-binding chemotaxis protein CheW
MARKKGKARPVGGLSPAPDNEHTPTGSAVAVDLTASSSEPLIRAAEAKSLAESDESRLSADEVSLILQQRALDLARAPAPAEEGTRIRIVIFAIGDERYAIPAEFVEAINLLEELTPVPCTPNFVAGIVNIRGRILSVLDIHRLLGLEKVQIDDDTQIIAVSAAGLEVGLLVNQVHAVRHLLLEELEPALPTTTPIAAEYTRGVTPDMTVLLDLEALLEDERIIVREEVA